MRREDNQLTALDVSQNKNLEVVTCGNNQLTSLNLSGTKVKTLQTDGNSYAIHVSGEGTLDLSVLPGFEVSKASGWTNGTVSGNTLTVTDVSKSVTYQYVVGLPASTEETRTFTLTHEHSLSKTDYKAPTDVSDGNIEYYYCSSCKKYFSDAEGTDEITQEETVLDKLSQDGLAIDATNFPDAAFRKYVSDNFDTNGNGSLSDREIALVKEIDCQSMGITTLKGVENFTELESLNCNVNPLKSLDVSRNKKLTELQCSNTQLTALDVSQNPLLEILNCAINSLKTLNLANNKSLETLQCEDNQLTALDISQNTNLEVVTCGNNQLTSLNMDKNEKLNNLNAENNTYTISLGADRTFDLSTLPGGFDVDRASGWDNGQVEGTKLTVNADAASVTYNYQVSRNNGETVTFTLLIAGKQTTPDRAYPDYSEETADSTASQTAQTETTSDRVSDEKAPKTADESSLMLWFLLMLCGGAAFAGLILKRKAK